MGGGTREFLTLLGRGGKEVGGMTPDVVVDVGNTRIKWGRCPADAVTEMASLAPEEAAWEEQATRWELPRPAGWAVAGAHPARREAVRRWIEGRGDRVVVLEDWRRLPLEVNVPEPAKVGIDRLLDAVAAKHHRLPGTPVVVVDAGSAVTVDYLDAAGVFQGGAILPGLGLMARALHEHTALLPLVAVPEEAPELPAKATIPAMQAGIVAAAGGGVIRLIGEYSSRRGLRPQVFLTGGDAPRLGHIPDGEFWPELTLEGIRLSARALP
jgi:type III pantothenate kinase